MTTFLTQKLFDTKILLPKNTDMSQDSHTHEDGPKSRGDGLKISELRDYIEVKDGVLYWKREPHVKGARVTGQPCGYHSRTKWRGRVYQGNVIINFLGERYTAQYLAWALYHGEVLSDNVEVIHLDGDKTNNRKENLTVRVKWRATENPESEN